MTRTRSTFAALLPALVAGGVLFASAFGRADDGRTPADAWAPTAPMPPSPPTVIAQAPHAPKPPVPPGPAPTPPPMPPTPTAGGRGIGVTIHDGKLAVTGARALADEQIARALDVIRTNAQIPPTIRDQLVARLGKVQASIDKRLEHLDLTNLDQLGEDLDQMGDEISEAFDGFDVNLGDVLGKDFGKDFGKQFGPGFGKPFHGHAHDRGRRDHDRDDDGDDDDDDARAPAAPDIEVDIDDDDVDDAISDLGDLALKPDQRAAIAKLRTDVKTTVGPARKRIDTLSSKLHDTLGNGAATDAEISKAVDAISAEEATIRKARILAWVTARRILDADQRKKVEGAAAKKPTK